MNVSFSGVDSFCHGIEGVIGDFDTSFLPESEIIGNSKFMISEVTAYVYLTKCLQITVNHTLFRYQHLIKFYFY